MAKKTVYFDVPDRHSVVYVDVDKTRDIEALRQDVSRIMGAAAVRISRKYHQQKMEKYRKDYEDAK